MFTRHREIYQRSIQDLSALNGNIESELDRLVEEWILIPVESSEWGVPVLKYTRDVRLCGDYKITLNPNIKIARHPIPRAGNAKNVS